MRRALDTRRNTPLSPAALEVLAIIAYNQPVSRSFIEQVRGVDSSSTVQTLLQKGLVEEAGRLDLPGRPISFRTTDVFLRTFGISSLAQLPPLHGDDYMLELDKRFPQYMWRKNKGYPTKEHREAIRRYGTTPFHRMSFTLLPDDGPVLPFDFGD